MWETVISKSGRGIVIDKASNQYFRFTATQDELAVNAELRPLPSRSSKLGVMNMTLTHDGKYILFTMSNRLLCMRRYSDNKLLAQYTVYDPVCSLAVSTNSRYVLIGTSDRRLLTLVIADPDEREHDERIAYVRAMNPGLSMEQAMALIGEANSFEGDDSDESYDAHVVV